MSALSGFAGGFAEGFGYGVQSGAKLQEVRGKRRYKDKYGEGIPSDFTGDGEVPTKVPSTDTDTTSSTKSKAKPGEIETYIRQAASKYGIDPEIAVRVAQSEGGLNDPFRQGEAMLSYGREQSYGPFQLHIRGGGVGERAIAAGIDPRKDWKGGIDYALKEASQKGWGQWFGAAKAKIGNWEGIGGPHRKPSSVPSTETAPVDYDTAIPDEETAPEKAAPAVSEPAAPAEEAPAEEQVSWELPDVALPELTDWSEFARLAAVQPPQEEVYAASGGVIPEPRQRFAAGGVADKYNPARGYTQAPAAAAGAPAWTPRRVGQAPTATSVGGVTLPNAGGTPGQLALRQAQANLTTKRAADAAALAAAKPTEEKKALPPSRTRDWRQAQEKKYGAYPGENWRDARSRYNQNLSRTVSRGNESDYSRSGFGSSRDYSSGVGLYARGGIVSVDPEYWQAALKREASGGGDQQAIRDRAARRVNREKGGGSSTAIRVGKEAPKGKAAKETSVRRTTQKKAAEKPVPVPTPAPRRTPDKVDIAGTAPTSVTPKKTTEPEKIQIAGVAPQSAASKLRVPQAHPDVQPDEGRRKFPELPADQVLPDEGRRKFPENAPPPVIPTEADNFDITRDPWELLTPDAAPAPPPDVRPREPVELPGIERDWYLRDEPSIVPAIPEPHPVPAPQQLPEGLPRELQPPRDGAPVAGPGGPRFNIDSVVQIVNDALPAIPERAPAGSPAGGPGAPRITAESLQQLARQAVSAGGEGARRVLENIWNVVKSKFSEPARPTGPGMIGTGPGINDLVGILLGNEGRAQSNPNAGPGFARGGLVPEEDEAAPLGGRRPEQYASQARGPRPQIVDPGTGARSAAIPPREQRPGIQDMAQAEEPPKQDVRPTRKLMDHVAIALDGGLRRIQRTFGLESSGALPTEGDARGQEEGAARMASGEGAASQQEINQVDDAIDPERQLNDADRHMIRLAKSTQWYLQQGRKDDAEASAEALILFGAKRFGQLGQLAGAAYRQYEATKDPKHLDATVKVLEKAYGLIPDGGKLDISINPETNTLQVTKLTAEGEEVSYDVSPEQLQGIIAGAMSGSIYWEQVMSLADPAGARSRASDKRQAETQLAIDRRQARSAADTERRQEEAATTAFERQTEAATTAAERAEAAADKRNQAQIESQEKQFEYGEDRDLRKEKLALEKEERERIRYENRWAREHPKVPFDKLKPITAELAQIQQAMADDEGNEELTAAYAEKASRMFDVLTASGIENPEREMEDLGHPLEGFGYVEAETPPVPGARKAPDGFWYVPKPGGGLQKLVPETAPAG